MIKTNNEIYDSVLQKFETYKIGKRRFTNGILATSFALILTLTITIPTIVKNNLKNANISNPSSNTPPNSANGQFGEATYDVPYVIDYNQAIDELSKNEKFKAMLPKNFEKFKISAIRNSLNNKTHYIHFYLLEESDNYFLYNGYWQKRSFSWHIMYYFYGFNDLNFLCCNDVSKKDLTYRNIPGVVYSSQANFQKHVDYLFDFKDGSGINIKYFNNNDIPEFQFDYNVVLNDVFI